MSAAGAIRRRRWTTSSIPTRYQHIARVLEAAKFDGCFFADLFGLYDLHQGGFDAYVRRGGQISYLDPTVVLPVMAAATQHLGLGATLSTSFHTAYHLARWLGLARRDERGTRRLERGDIGHRSRGAERRPRRPAAEGAALRPRRRGAGGLLRAVEQLGRRRAGARQGGWDHVRPGQGALRQLRGPLDQDARPAVDPAQSAGTSGDHAGRQLAIAGAMFAARWAEAIFTIQRGEAEMREFYDDIKSRMAGRRARAERVRHPAGRQRRAGRNRIDRPRACRLPQQPDRPRAEPGGVVLQPRCRPDQAGPGQDVGRVAGQPGHAGLRRCRSRKP